MFFICCQQYPYNDDSKKWWKISIHWDIILIIELISTFVSFHRKSSRDVWVYYSPPDGSGEICDNWISSILNCRLTGSKFTNTKRRDELVVTPCGCASKQERQLLSLDAFWIQREKQWFSLSWESSEAALSCLLDYLLRESIVSQESNKAKPGDSEETMSFAFALLVFIWECSVKIHFPKMNYDPLKPFTEGK